MYEDSLHIQVRGNVGKTKRQKNLPSSFEIVTVAKKAEEPYSRFIDGQDHLYPLP